jgi:hypothetical protein
MTELDRWQEDARAVLELRGEPVTWQAVNALAEKMRRNHARLADEPFERDRVGESVRRQRRVVLARGER